MAELVKIAELLGSKTVHSNKTGKDYPVTSFKDGKGTVAETFDRIEVGKEYKMEYKQTNYGVQAKIVREGGSGAGGGSSNPRGEALLAAAMLMTKSESKMTASQLTATTFKLADEMLTYIKDEVKTVQPAPEKEEVITEDDTDDLGF